METWELEDSGGTDKERVANDRRPSLRTKLEERKKFEERATGAQRGKEVDSPEEYRGNK